jgi:hypothetical protein
VDGTHRSVLSVCLTLHEGESRQIRNVGGIWRSEWIMDTNGTSPKDEHRTFSVHSLTHSLRFSSYCAWNFSAI